MSLPCNSCEERVQFEQDAPDDQLILASYACGGEGAIWFLLPAPIVPSGSLALLGWF
jgi:hypothetical protein